SGLDRFRSATSKQSVGLEGHSGVERLHCGVGKMRRFVDRFHDLPLGQRILDIAIIARAYHRSIERIPIKLGELGAVGLSGLADLPVGLEQGASASLARQNRSATTTTASSSLTTCSTPRRPFAGESSTLLSLPPNTGQAATAAYAMSGTCV